MIFNSPKEAALMKRRPGAAAGTRLCFGRMLRHCME